MISFFITSKYIFIVQVRVYLSNQSSSLQFNSKNLCLFISSSTRSTNLGLGIARRRSLRRRVVARAPPIQNIASSYLVPLNTFITFIYYKNYQKKALLFINKSISRFVSTIVQSIYQKTKPRALTLLFYTTVNKGNYLI